MNAVQQWIERLGLMPHPEGGYYRETYRAGEVVAAAGLPPRFGGGRAHSTAIYYLLSGNEVSVFHRLKADELWHFYEGDPLEIHMLGPRGSHTKHVLGREAERGQAHQVVVPAGAWFGAALVPGGRFTLAGCTAAPGFEFEDFELGDRELLLEAYPAQREIVMKLTQPSQNSSADPAAGKGPTT